jgi:hypothetical protein
MLLSVALPLGLWVGSTSLLGFAAFISLSKSRHERSMMLMGMGVFYIGTLCLQVVAGIWLFFSALTAGTLLVGDAFKAAFGMVALTSVLVGVVGR